MPNPLKIMIIGGGAAGFFAAIHNKKSNPNSTVIIIEKSNEVLSKVKVSGGGRCNVTHACFDPKSLCDAYPRGAKELLGPFHLFQPQDTMAWFESQGVPLKVESDKRVFPVSDSSQSIIDCLVNTIKHMDIKLWTRCQVTQLSKTKSDFCLTLSNGQTHLCQKLILATGSNRQGHDFAKNLGHTIEPPVPSLFTVKINDKPLQKLAGLSVSDTEVWLAGNKKSIQSGPLLLTHWGMSGPSIIKLSAWNAIPLHQANYQVTLCVNYLPSLDTHALKSALRSFQKQNPKKSPMTRSPFPEIPHRLWEYLANKAQILPSQIWANLSNKQFYALSQELSEGTYQVVGKGQFKEEFVTCGGVALKEINFKTMESRCCHGLHIVGELLNIDGITGGFNFQNAWTTGFISALRPADPPPSASPSPR